MYADMILMRDVTERGLRTGDVGTVVERHAESGVSEEGYSVEFFDLTGNTSGSDHITGERQYPGQRSLRYAMQSLQSSQSVIDLVPTRENAAHQLLTRFFNRNSHVVFRLDTLLTYSCG